MGALKSALLHKLNSILPFSDVCKREKELDFGLLHNWGVEFYIRLMIM